MTYIDLINDFWQEYEDMAMKPIDALFYLFLLKTCNSKRWENPFALSNKRIKLTLEISDKVIIESRSRLIERGLIEVEKGDRNSIAPTYKLLRVCFPTESKKGSKKGCRTGTKTESKNGSKTESKNGYCFPSESKTESKTESRNGNIIKDIDIKTYRVVANYAREEFFNDFFKIERKATIEALCMNLYTDEQNLKRLAKEVLDDWEATSQPIHQSISEAQKHLLSQIRIKLNIERRQNKNTNGTINIGNSQSAEQRRREFEQSITDLLARGDSPEPDISGNY